MADRTRIEFAHSAQDDLLDIMAWYSSQQVPDVGKRLVAAIIDRFHGSARSMSDVTQNSSTD